MKNKLFFIIISFCFSTFLASQNTNGQDLPVLGDYSSSSISLSGEYNLGRIWLSMYRSVAQEHDDPMIRTYLEDLLYRLSEDSDVQDRRFEFIVLEDKSINAFAAPGGIIGINLGMFLETRKEGELASVMCHELAHLSQRHYARSQNRSSPLANALMVLGSIVVAAASRNPEAILIAPAAMQQMSINFTRSNEKEADRIGFNNLVKAGFNPDDMTSMFQRMQDKYQSKSSEEFSYLMTHPLPSERLSDMRVRADNLPKSSKNNYRDNIDFYLMQKRVEIWSEQNANKLIKRYKKNLKSTNDQILISNKYGLALAHKENKEFNKAFELIRELIKENPNNLVLETSLLELHLAAGNYFEAISLGAFPMVERLPKFWYYENAPMFFCPWQFLDKHLSLSLNMLYSSEDLVPFKTIADYNNTILNSAYLSQILKKIIDEKQERTNQLQDSLQSSQRVF